MTAVFTRQPAHPVPGDWAKRAACIGHPRRDMWFADEPSDRKIAIAICYTCPVVAECREHGISHEAHGIWGGLSENERRRARRQRRHGQEVGAT